MTTRDTGQAQRRNFFACRPLQRVGTPATGPNARTRLCFCIGLRCQHNVSGLSHLSFLIFFALFVSFLILEVATEPIDCECALDQVRLLQISCPKFLPVFVCGYRLLQSEPLAPPPGWSTKRVSRPDFRS